MMKTITDVHIYMSDISPDRFLSGPNLKIGLFMPEMLIPRADEICSLKGMLVEYIARHPDDIKSQWVANMSIEDWRSFTAKEFLGRDHRVCQIHTSNIAYTVVVVMAEEQSAAARQTDQLLSLEGPGYKLTIHIPPDWLQSKTNSGYVLRPANAKSLPSPEGPVFSPAILLMSAPIQKPIQNIQAFVNGWFDEESQKMFHRFGLVSQRASEVSGCPASWFEFQFDKLSHRWAAIVLVISDGRVVHYADGSLLVSDQSLWYRIVKDVLESFCVSYHQTRTQAKK